MVFYDVATALAATMMAGNELAIAAFIHPQLSRLGAESHAPAAAVLARILGKVMPLWYGLALLLIAGAAYEHRPLGHGPGLLIASAAALWAATIVWTITMLVPINNRIAALDGSHPYAGWLADRARWDSLHRARVLLLVIAVVLLLTGLLGGQSTL